MSDELERIREANLRARERCARCGEERQSHACVQSIYGTIWICQSVVFIAASAPAEEMKRVWPDRTSEEISGNHD